MAEPGDRAEKLRAGKLEVDVAMVGRLIVAQFPQWAHLPVHPVANDGWDNWTFRLGDRMKVRLPSAAGYVGQVEKEARWLPRLAPQLPLPVSVPLGVGGPGEGYPWPWLVLDWIEGEVAARERVDDPTLFARDVADFIAALQRIDTNDGPRAGPHSYFRGSSIEVYADEARHCIEALAGRIDTATADAVMDVAVAATWQGPDVWVHGDIAAGNLLLRDGRLAAVIDFGCAAVGDPACDLVLAWVFLEGEAREAFRARVPGDHAMWARARGWALWKAALLMAEDAPINRDEASPAAVIEAVLGEHRQWT